MKLLILLLFVSCQGYQLQTKKNPFSRYGVTSVAVENFYNHSNMNNVSSSFTKEMVFMLSSFSKLKVKNNTKNVDAVLVGIIESTDSRRESRVRSDDIVSSSILENRVDSSKRVDYYIPTKTTLKLNLKLMLIKSFKRTDINSLKTDGELIDPRVLFTERIPLTEAYTREVLDGATNNFTTTRANGAEKNALEQMAINAANTFKEMILYAF